MHCKQNVLGINSDAYFSVLSSCSVIQNVLTNEFRSVMVSNTPLSEFELRPQNLLSC
jgi:hypothetical protein